MSKEQSKALFYTQGEEEVLKSLDTSIDGLSTAQAKERLDAYGYNELDEGFKTQEYGIASSESNQELIDYTNDLLAKWQKDGSLQKLYDKYHLKPAKAEDK